MIALLTGQIAHKSPDHIILDVNGVGYRILIPFSTYYELPEEGGTASLHIHTSVREDAIQLYGFRTRLEKSFFQLLISVTGVGPKLAATSFPTSSRDLWPRLWHRATSANSPPYPESEKKPPSGWCWN